MDAVEKLRSAGLTKIEVDGPDLVIGPDQLLTDDLVEFIRENKETIMSALQTSDAPKPARTASIRPVIPGETAPTWHDRTQDRRMLGDPDRPVHSGRTEAEFIAETNARIIGGLAQGRRMPAYALNPARPEYAPVARKPLVGTPFEMRDEILRLAKSAQPDNPSLAKCKALTIDLIERRWNAPWEKPYSDREGWFVELLTKGYDEISIFGVPAGEADPGHPGAIRPELLGLIPFIALCVADTTRLSVGRFDVECTRGSGGRIVFNSVNGRRQYMVPWWELCEPFAGR